MDREGSVQHMVCDVAHTAYRMYRANVVGGPGSFLLAARGYGDFARALRQKFVLEISWLEPARRP